MENKKYFQIYFLKSHSLDLSKFTNFPDCHVLLHLSTKIPKPFFSELLVNYTPVISMSSLNYFNIHYFALVNTTFHLLLCWPLALSHAVSVLTLLHKCITWKCIGLYLFFSTIQDTLTHSWQIICMSIKAT